MEIDRIKPDGGLFFRLESMDWNSDWRTFIEGVKMVGGKYKPIEKPDNENWWYVPESGVKEFYQFRKQLFHDEDQLDLFGGEE
jgi:hypothetical protein